MRYKRVACVVASTLLAGAAVAVGVARPASGDDGRHEIQFTVASNVTQANFGEAFVGDVSRCSFDATFDVSEPCVVPVTQAPGFDEALSGDIVGKSASADGAVLAVGIHFLLPNDVPFVRFGRVVGRVDKCGSGSFILRGDGNLNSPNDTWQIVPNSGRGELTGLKGSGTLVTSFDGPNGTTLNRFAGRIRCGRHHDD